ncbi:MAG: hypothetical protein FWH38_09385, partial [Treponema sp.]|nr:hypothetical protein [Treponema sp.]
MEKKKLLLVAVSVGVVLLILICIPLMVIAPKQHSAPLARQQRPDYTVSAPLVIEPSGQSLEQSPILPLPDPAPAAGGAQQADNP